MAKKRKEETILNTGYKNEPVEQKRSNYIRLHIVQYYFYNAHQQK